MIINAETNGLLKLPPKVPPQWQDRFAHWLTVVLADSFLPVFKIQLEMVKAIIELEKEAQIARSESKALRVDIPGLKSTSKMNEVRAIQEKSTHLAQRVEQLNYLRHCILFIGDTMAVKISDLDTIKAFACYPAPGFLSGKEGLAAEIDAAEHFFRQGYMVLINDLTHCMRLGDLTLRKGEEVRTFEVKSNVEAYRSRDAMRQIVLPIGIHSYIRTDVLKGPIKVQGRAEVAAGAVRLDSDIKEDWHRGIAGMLYRSLRKSRIAHVEIGEKHYLASRRTDLDSLQSELAALTDRGQWVVGNLRKRVTDYADVPPFSMWFRPISTVELMAGDVTVLTAFSMSELAELFGLKGFEATWKPERRDLFPLNLSPNAEVRESDREVEYLAVGEYQRLKMLYSFLAAESFVDICAFLMSPEALAQHKAKLRGATTTLRRQASSENP